MPTPLAKNLAHIHAACFTVPRPWTEKEFEDLLKYPHPLIITHPHRFIMGRWADSEQIELITLGVEPAHQNKGYGRELLKEFIAEVTNKGGKIIFLDVAENNAKALHLYKEFGFTKIGMRPAYYDVPDSPNAPKIDGVVMRLDIK